MAEKKKDSISDLDIANFLHSKRTPKAQAVDNGTKARVTKNLGLWLAEPNRYDMVGVDEPSIKGKKKVIKKGARAKLSKYDIKVN